MNISATSDSESFYSVASDTMATDENTGSLAIVPLEFTIQVPDLLNGDITKVTQAAPKASVDRAYKWATIQGLAADQSVNAVYHIIRATYAHLMVCAGAEVNESAAADLRRKAIVLGAVRAGASAAYKLSEPDMNISECVYSGMDCVDGRIQPTQDNATSANRWTLASGMKELAREEIGVVGTLVYLGMAVPVLQGASLVNSGHHYLPTTKNIFMGMKRQMIGLNNDAGKQWIEAMGDAFDDMAFHKACHPISPPRKRMWAKKADVAMRLHASGHGAASIRLPAIPSDAAIGKTAIALANAAQATIKSMGHHISVDNGTQLIKDLEKAEEGQEERDAVAAIQSWAQTHMGSLAFCAGILQHVHETSGVGRNTLLSAYSVKKLMADNLNSVQVGVTYARVAASKLRESMEKGEFSDPNIVM